MRDFNRSMESKKKRVLLGMSGGVDSSIAGYLLREQEYDVVGVTMKVWPQDCISRAEDKCCGPQAVADAREIQSCGQTFLVTPTTAYSCSRKR